MLIARRLRTFTFLVKMHVKVALGLPVRTFGEDRRVLETVIMEAYARRADIKRVLFVGCAPYTAHYETLWPTQEFWTIDVQPQQRRFGARRHVVGSIEALHQYFAAGYLDLIICNGVIGFGLNTQAGCERAFEACFRALRPGGELVLGWNQVPEYGPVWPEQIEALRAFEPVVFGPLGTWRHEIKNDLLHTFDFYQRPALAPNTETSPLARNDQAAP